MNLGDIIQFAMDRTNEQSNRSTGSYSLAWWTRQVNRAKDVLAQETGYITKRHAVSLTASTQISTLPSTLCWGITSAYLGTRRLESRTESEMDEDFPGWRYQSSFPNQPANDGIEVISDNAADTTQKCTIYGTTYSTGAYASEGVTMNGTTQVATVKTDWDEIYYISLDNECAGTVTVREASAGATITTIAAGDTTSGTAISTAAPLYYVVRNPNIEWYPIPDANYTVWVVGGELPTDFSTPASIAAATDTPTGLPAQFHYLLGEGAATLACYGDLSKDNAEARASVSGQAFWKGVDALNAYLANIARDRVDTVRVDTSLSTQHYNR